MRPIDANDLKGRLMDSYDPYHECGTVIEIDVVTDMIDEAPTINEWISVEERLPDKYVDVLVCLRLTKLTRVRSLGDGNVWSDAYGYTEDFDEVTHWMPLPEPPEVSK